MCDLNRTTQVKGRNLLEHEAMQLLAKYGIPVPPFQVLSPNKPFSLESLDKIQYPVVVKVISPDIVHKTEVGGVRLNLKSAVEIGQAIEEMSVSIGNQIPGVKIEGWLIYPYLTKGTELIVGSIIDLQFGPAVMLGIGGVLTEVYRDVSFRLVPLSPIDALEMVEELKAQPLLQGVRGRKAVDKETLCALLGQLNKMIQENPEIVECDLNPIICRGKDIKVVDARIKVMES